MIYNNLMYEIKRANINIKEFCKCTNIKYKRFLNILKGVEIITYKEICKICEFFNLKFSIDYLFQEKTVET